MSDFVELQADVGSVLRARAGAYLELAKLRIAVLVLVATGLGFYMALGGGVTVGAALPLLINTIVGTALVAAGANAMNQLLEVRFDARMARTADRPLPTGRLSKRQVSTFGLAAGGLGVVHLAWTVNLQASAVAALTFVLYVWVYTPLKRVTSMSVFVGAVPGALPSVIGWAAASGSLTAGAGLLFAIVFFWQLPHFASIGWLYRKDYRRGGYPVLAVIDKDGTRTSLHVITHSVGLIGASVLPVLYGMAGVAYGVGAVVLGLAFLASGIQFVARRTDAVARFHLLASIVYLPLLCALMMMDKTSMP